jgi:hypothetical protein
LLKRLKRPAWTTPESERPLAKKSVSSRAYLSNWQT